MIRALASAGPSLHFKVALALTGGANFIQPVSLCCSSHGSATTFGTRQAVAKLKSIAQKTKLLVQEADAVVLHAEHTIFTVEQVRLHPYSIPPYQTRWQARKGPHYRSCRFQTMAASLPWCTLSSKWPGPQPGWRPSLRRQTGRSPKTK